MLHYNLKPLFITNTGTLSLHLSMKDDNISNETKNQFVYNSHTSIHCNNSCTAR